MTGLLQGPRPAGLSRVCSGLGARSLQVRVRAGRGHGVGGGVAQRRSCRVSEVPAPGVAGGTGLRGCPQVLDCDVEGR